MRRALLATVVLVLSVVGLFVPTSAAPVATRSLGVTGDGVAMYPAFDPAIDRYAVTTTGLTRGTVDVTARPGPGETVTIDGGSATHLTGLADGQRIKVAFLGGPSPHTYTVIYLPAGFPKLTVTTGAHGSAPDVEPGLIALTLNTFSAGGHPAFDAIVDRNGVPVYAIAAQPQDLDLKQQPSGEITVQRPPATAGRTGVAQVTLDPGAGLAEEPVRREVVAPLTNTDGHDSVRLPDGSTILIGYQPNGSKTDATIQKLDPAGNPTFTWSSGTDPTIAADTTADSATRGPSGDYAHINSVVSVEHGDIIASFRHLSAAYRIATVAHDGFKAGDIIWRFGGRHSDFTFVGGPVGGPCAQHSVSQLPNGHLLVFDNGSGGISSSMCLDDGPGAATTSRPETHVEEYALDTAAHTATLVWSYPADASKYAFFAGSARRTPNGDTLISWSADKNALTTEVDSGGQKLWELTTPATDVNDTARYMTYRAELITALRPRITTALPDGATVLAGDTVAGGARCSDWRGEAIDCTVTGPADDNLDTTTLGGHTWQVAAQDGAGNTTTVVRHYTVRLPRHQPDGLIRKAGTTSWKGGNIYRTRTGQTVRQRPRRGHAARVAWRVQNDGERADGFRLVGTPSSARMRVHYFAGTTDVTGLVMAGTYRTPPLAPGQSFSLLVEVTPTLRARLGAERTFVLRAVSVSDGARIDAVTTIVTVRR